MPQNKKILLQVEHIYKNFGQLEVLKDISFDIHQQEVIVIIGPSGCGKSTLLRCLNGLEKINSGDIKLDGQIIGRDEKQWTEIRQKIGMVFQSYELFPHLTVKENILLAPMKVQKRSKEQVWEQAEALLKRTGLLDKADYFPRQLSGGQKQRVAIVRALCMNPELILFDEVTAALDPGMVREVLELMRELARQGSTMLIVTHEMNFAKAVANKIIFMHGGVIKEISPPEQFFTKPQTKEGEEFLASLFFD